ncbi:autophagy-related protein 16 [Podospora appendiculata]|uniref:Autophagy-related protein 16 n=1 Tax=Podospora appendiculata TaxID=314037 RepID=A0AAE1CF88_9PEZI|nr:autophagy-related protein 16 [Podospora appendiculata]
MPGWRDEYLSGILEAEKRNPVNREIVEACSQLGDRISALEAEKAALEASNNSNKTQTPGAAAAPAATDPSSPAPDDTAIVARLRLELAEALRAKGQFQSRLQTAEDELVRLRAKTAADAKAIRDMTAERRTLQFKLRDRDEELRVKNKLVADVQDELAVLNMQLDMVERQRAEKEAENKQLVQRFIQRVGQEVDAMNLANEPLFSKKR